MDTIAVAPKASALASPKIVKNAKGNIVPSSQMAHIAYGCGEHLPRELSDTRLLIPRRTHGRNVREGAQADTPALPGYPPEHPREAKHNSADVQCAGGGAQRRVAEAALSVSAVPEHHDRGGSGSAL
ncbi:hypothetical protein IG631_01702 [Alternaria alternata]|nr:hypothetical protein IG631_01702 [Alternaria alternata]